MANRKVTSAPKVAKSEVQETEVTQKVEKEITKKKFAQEDGIMCRSVTVGGLWYTGPKSGLTYNFVEYGDETEIEYRDLVASVRSRSNYIFGPFFVIEDDEFIAEFPQLQKYYDEQYTVDDLRGVLDLSVDDMVATIQTLPPRAVNSLKSIASTLVSSGQLDSVRKIKALDDLFGTELNLLASLME